MESRSTMFPASLAAEVPVFMATPTSAWASAGASLVPSPVIATSFPPSCSRRISAILSSGAASARTSSTPASWAMAWAVSGLSPVIMTVLMPIRRSWSNRSRIPSLTTSLRWTTPSTRASDAPPRRVTWPTTSGVPPLAEMPSTMCPTSSVGCPPLSRTQRITAVAAPLRSARCSCGSSRSTPLIRLCAVNGTNPAPASSPSLRPRSACCSLARTTMERPSGVSSAIEDSCAASASSSADTPGTGRNAVACRLPRVIVPVLSNSRVLTSPAASTARPDIASTLRWTSRSMPAMPMAGSSAPIVVGMSATTRATRMTRVCSAPAKTANGWRVTTATRKTIVSDASRMVSAISLGVFCRAAPSTRAIIRSRKVSPGRAVILTTIRSESTFVPPVTADRSPPDSRITGADSPVMADSSTLAMPSTTSPSPGIGCPASTTTWSPGRRSTPGTFSSTRAVAPGCQSRSRRALTVVLVRRRAAACALPRPSATASARLAKTTVSHSQAAMTQAKALGVRSADRTVSVAPTSTTNITGLCTITRGSSLRSASGRERTNWRGSSSPPETRRAGRSAPGGAVDGGVVEDISAAPPPAGPAPVPGSTSGRRR
ncbi:hypothetical protein P354_25245 [Streptomyces noursei PD-1]|nr:hypothetical protein P354_25245 [Streptomyces noursei PD-1]